MKILVTGGAGFIASHVVNDFVSLGHDVVIVDNLITGKEKNIHPSAKFYNVDICDFEQLESVFKSEKPDIVDHHAAQVNLRRSMTEPIFDAKVNLIGSLNLIELSKKYNLNGFIYISTGGAVYGEPEHLPVNETAQIEPLSQYGVDKHTVEHFLHINKQQGLNYITLRYPNVYGPRQDPSGEAGVVAVFSIQILNGQKPTIFGDGSKTRDYVYVGDISKANVLALDHLEECKAFNIGWGKEISDLTIFNTIKKALNSDIEPIFGEKRLGEIDRICLDNTKIKQTLGWSPTISLEEGVKLATEYYEQVTK